MFKKPPLYLLVITFIVLTQTVIGQSLNNQKNKYFKCQDTLKIDSLSLVPNSIQLLKKGVVINATQYKIDYSRGIIILKQNCDSIQVKYRVFPFSFSQKHFNKDISIVEQAFIEQKNPFKLELDAPKNDLFELNGLNKSGSISRGISFGNNQDLSVNSNLNLQLSGKINDRVSVLAAITDDNIPIQPEGNTQQLQDFAQISIQLYDDNTRLKVGDFQIKNNPNRFLKYHKKSQGGSITTPLIYPQKNNSESMILRASGGISKGKFSRNRFIGIEGNQGPYRLKGAQNESFIIILSGTERIFLNGKQLIRGKANDYTIDYNTAELTFTPKNLITKDKRIIAEFQYSDRNYARTFYELSNSYKNNKLNLDFNVYSEQDAKNQPLQVNLNEQQKNILRTIGDSLQNAVSSSVNAVDFNSDLILYKLLIDSLSGDSIYKFSTHPDSAKYQITFSLVGIGKGDYNQAIVAANGKIFEYVGKGQGQFLPVVKLPAPNKSQMVTTSGKYRISPVTSIYFDAALSNHDINTFSKLDTKDNKGFSAYIGIENKLAAFGNDTNKWFLTTKIEIEQVNKNFSRIQRFRSVEFNRDWNINQNLKLGNQNTLGTRLNLSNQKYGTINYLLQYYQNNIFTGYRNELKTNLNGNKWYLKSRTSITNTNAITINTRFLRNYSTLIRKTKKLLFGFNDQYENNTSKTPSIDSLVTASNGYFQYRFFITNPDSTKSKYTISYLERRDFSPSEGRFKESTLGKNIAASFDFFRNTKNSLKTRTTYRNLIIKDSNLTSQKADNTLLNRVEYRVKLLKNVFRLNSFYEIGSGTQIKKNFTFLEVPNGQGIYQYDDLNNNGIKELNEFNKATFSDRATYIKVFTPTNELVKVFSNQFNQSIFINPRAAWRRKKGVKKWISKFSDQLSYKAERKISSNKINDIISPFKQTQLGDTAIISVISSFRNVLYFNKFNAKFGADISYQNLQNKVPLTTGAESRKNEFTTLKLRWNATKIIMATVSSKTGSKSNTSELFNNNNFDVSLIEIEPKITFQPTTRIRSSVSYNYKKKQNSVDLGNELARNQKLSVDFKYNTQEKGSLLMTINYVKINYNGTQNNTLSFEMLEGLQKGNNATWQLSYQTTLSNNLQLNINYSGRKSQGSPVVHTGGVQVRAFF